MAEILSQYSIPYKIYPRPGFKRVLGKGALIHSHKNVAGAHLLFHSFISLIEKVLIGIFVGEVRSSQLPAIPRQFGLERVQGVKTQALCFKYLAFEQGEEVDILLYGFCS